MDYKIANKLPYMDGFCFFGVKLVLDDSSIGEENMFLDVPLITGDFGKGKLIVSDK